MQPFDGVGCYRVDIDRMTWQVQNNQVEMLLNPLLHSLTNSQHNFDTNVHCLDEDLQIL